MPELILFRFAINIARGMAALAEAKIIHRDLSARNVLLDMNFEPKVSDFGLSRVVEDVGASGKTNSNTGPIRWMAPEALKSQAYSEKSDVYSYACTLVEILTGHVPFAGIDMLDVVLAVRDKMTTPLDEVSQDIKIPKWILSVLEDCFRYDPTARPSFNEIIAMLEKNAPSEVLAVERKIERRRKKREEILAAIDTLVV